MRGERLRSRFTAGPSRADASHKECLPGKPGEPKGKLYIVREHVRESQDGAPKLANVQASFIP
jgi:hypothetical protein